MRKDLTGLTFGNLTVISKESVSKNKKTLWRCKCNICGNQTVVIAGHLTSNHTTTCGCIRQNGTMKEFKRLYQIWIDLRRRCYNSSNKSYKYYGELGISVCQEWLNSFRDFKKWSIKNGYRDDLTIDRIDNYKGYQPDNCRWVTRAENNKNKRKAQDRFETIKVINSAKLLSTKVPKL